MRILYVNPVGTPLFDKGMKEVLLRAANKGTDVEVVSLKRDHGTWNIITTNRLSSRTSYTWSRTRRTVVSTASC